MARRGENIYKRKDGRYEGRYIKKYDLNGKAIYGYIYAWSYTEVKEKLIKAKNKPPKITGSAMKLKDWLIAWIESVSVKESTRALYRQHIKKHIIPALGNVSMKKLSGERLQNFVSSIQLAPSTVRLIFTVLKSALKDAEDAELIVNVWSKVKLPKKITSDVMALSTQEQKKLESALTDDNDIGILICLYMGLRIGELCALKWSDINFAGKVIHINGTQTRNDGELKITEPKSISSKRIIPIPDVLFEKLSAHKRAGEYVLVGQNGMMDVRTYRRRFKRLLKAAGLPDIKFHALRHTFATRALEVGMDYKTLSEILGHASVSITMDLYVHALDEHKRQQMNKLNTLFASPSK